jgi:hypothetical protein
VWHKMIGGVATVALLGAGVARADGNDDMFLQLVNGGGFPAPLTKDPSGMINLGHKICDGLVAGAPYDTVKQVLMSGEPSWHLTQDQAGRLMVISVAAYCPGWGHTQG